MSNVIPMASFRRSRSYHHQPCQPREEVSKSFAALFELTQAELARRSGVTERAFQHYLSGRSEPSLATLVRIASALGCTPNDLLGVGASRESAGQPHEARDADQRGVQRSRRCQLAAGA